MSTLLENFFPIADMIAGTFGKHCEVAIHDLRHPQSSVVYVANGSVTGRFPGQTFEHLIREVLLNKNFKNDSTLNYCFETEDGRKIKSSSSLIRDEKNEVIGMVCINIDLSFALEAQELLGSFLPPVEAPEITNSVASQLTRGEDMGEVSSIVNQLIENIIRHVDVSSMKRKDNLALIDFMDKKGIFLVKGALENVAERLGVSKVTVYSYLDEVRKKNKQAEEPRLVISFPENE